MLVKPNPLIHCEPSIVVPELGLIHEMEESAPAGKLLNFSNAT